VSRAGLTLALALLAAGCETPGSHRGGVLEHPDHVRLVGAPGGRSVLSQVLSRDSDEDGIPDVKDNCPHEPGVEANYGCKDPQLVVLRADRIEILDKVYFRANTETIDARSHGLLDDIARVLRDHPEIRQLQVEGHTDDSGDIPADLSLSQRRADEVVRYLTKKGVAASRLKPRGLGSTQPLQSNDTAEGRAANRRVQFVIVDF